VSPISKHILCASPLALLLSAPALAQTETPAEPQGAGSLPVEPAAEMPQTEISFTADALNYDSEKDIVTASGNVRLSRGGEKVRADTVIWDRKSGEVRADGNVIVSSATGEIAYGDGVTLNETLRDGVVDNMLIVLKNGGRLVAKKAYRKDSVSHLEQAAYTPCLVVDEQGCPKEPVWKITAVEVIHDPKANRVRYKDAQIEIFGQRLLTIPRFSHPADDEGGTGLLIPDARYTQTNGLEFSLPYYVFIDRNRDLVITPHIYSGALPMLESRYRALTRRGAYQIKGYATYGGLIPTSISGTASQRNFRGYFEASGRFQLTPRWSVSGSLRAVTDRTFMRRYDISRDDRLRSMVEVQRVTRSSYFSLSSWGFQTLRPGEIQGQIPLALPIVDYRKRFDDPLVNGRLELQFNTVSLSRRSGQDTQRAFAGGRWDLRQLTGLGQEVSFTLYARGDLYHTDETQLTSVLPYRGQSGWSTRLVSAAAIDMRWPFIGPLFGGTQRLTPRLQIVTSPRTSNLKVPNEDARSVDLEDSNLFALNRFPGYDRWEDGTRITYGLDWGFEKPNWQVNATVGQSYRLSSKTTLFPDGTGLTNQTSDFVGRTSFKYKNFIAFTHRFRIDKDNLAVRRNELDATVGTTRTYITFGYLRLNRNVSPTLEDLRDREEIRLGGRVQMDRHWSVFGSTIIDLTDFSEDPVSLADGFQPIRHRFGFEYEDDCITFGITWKRDYEASGDARRGNTFVLRLSFRNLGR
jgi:LPS-assembly protein